MSLGSERHRHGEADGIVSNLVTAVSEATSVEPTELSPLYDTIDPDHLSSFVACADPTARLSFQYYGLEVTVDGDGTVHLQQPPDNE